MSHIRTFGTVRRTTFPRNEEEFILANKLANEERERVELFERAIHNKDAKLLKTVTPYVSDRKKVKYAFLDLVEKGNWTLPLVEAMINSVDNEASESAIFYAVENNEEELFNFLLDHPVHGTSFEWIYDFLKEEVQEGKKYIDQYYFDQLKTMF